MTHKKHLRFSLLLGLLSGLVLSCSSIAKRTPQSVSPEMPWYFEDTLYKVSTPVVDDVDLRTGYFLETRDVPFKGCIIYLQGLADSARNQGPIFKYLSQRGYRTLFFDFMGQGGSQGSMNNTRVFDPLSASLEITTQAKFVWDKYSTTRDSYYGRDCSQSKKMVLAWSTGGLGAYVLSHEEWADGVILLAPGIHTKLFVGASAKEHSLMLSLKQVITEDTLTRNKFAGTPNPHIDPIKPISPAVVPLFAVNLLLSSKIAQDWRISEKVKGLVFLSSPEDTYVDSEATLKTLTKNAPHFRTISYKGALHELSNELPEVTVDLYPKAAQFFDSVSGQ